MNGCLCKRCGKRYKVDLLIPDDLWYKINSNQDGGLLCGSCIMNAIEELNLYDAWHLTK